MLMSSRALVLMIGPPDTVLSVFRIAFEAFGDVVAIDPRRQDVAAQWEKHVREGLWTRPDLIMVTSLELIRRGRVQDSLSFLPPSARSDAPVVFAMSHPSGAEQVSACRNGALEILDASRPAAEIAARCCVLIENERVQRVQVATEGAQATLATLMRAGADGLRLDIAQTEDAADVVLSAIRRDGVDRWLKTVAYVHSRTYRHSLLMAGVTVGFLETLGIGVQDRARMTVAGLLHDVGKARVPVALLDKPGKLTAEEYDLVRCHAAWGYDMLVAQGEADALLLSVARSHHEYMDGSGYPDGLKREQIPDHVRIATICDIFTALIEPRSYKPSLPIPEAVRQLKLMSPKFDPDLLDVFLERFVPRLPVEALPDDVRATISA